MVNEDGSLRDSVSFSILAEKWLGAKRRLEELLAAHGMRMRGAG